MALIVADRVRETCTSPGTGTVTLLGAATGYQSFAAIGNGNTTYYTIADQAGANWEVGIGTYTSSGTTLARTTVLSSSNSGSLVNFSTGTQDVFVSLPSERLITGVGGGQGTIIINAQTISVNTIIKAGTNGFAVGPITQNSGTTFTIESGARYITI